MPVEKGGVHTISGRARRGCNAHRGTARSIHVVGPWDPGMTRDHRRLAAIVSADVVGYSLLMGRDDSATLAGLKAHRRGLIGPKIPEEGGRIVKTTGDGLLLE